VNIGRRQGNDGGKLTVFRPVLAAALLAAAASAAADDPSTYRLAGIIELGERIVALVELPEAGQMAVEIGDAVGESTVAAVDRHSLTLERNHERVVLQLEGAAAPALAAASAAPQVVARQVSGVTLERLAALRNSPGSRDDEVIAALNEVLELPGTTQAAPAGPGMERMPAVPARRLLERLYERLASGQPVKLYLDSSSADEIYLLPEPAGS
jgi:hypothetical protein